MAIMEINIEFPLKHRITICWYSNPTPGSIYIFPKDNHCGGDINTPMIIATIFTTAQIWKQPSAHWWINGWRNLVLSLSHTHTNKQILFNLTKEGNLAICNVTDEPRRHYANWNNSAKGQKLTDLRWVSSGDCIAWWAWLERMYYIA